VQLIIWEGFFIGALLYVLNGMLVPIVARLVANLYEYTPLTSLTLSLSGTL